MTGGNQKANMYCSNAIKNYKSSTVYKQRQKDFQQQEPIECLDIFISVSDLPRTKNGCALD